MPNYVRWKSIVDNEMQAVRNITTVKDETIVIFIKHEIQLTNDETDRKYDVSFGRLQKYFCTLRVLVL